MEETTQLPTRTRGTRATPSKKCEPCRIKRRRCDFSVPSCSQCIRAGITCPGYKDNFTLRLRDETDSTARKVHSKKGEAMSACVESVEASPGLAAPLDAVVGVSSIPFDSPSSIPAEFNLFEPITAGAFTDPLASWDTQNALIDPLLGDIEQPMYSEDQAAIAYFMHNCANHSSFWYVRQYYAALKTDETHVDDMVDAEDRIHLDDAISAAGLVLLSGELNRPRLLTAARKHYGTVLASTQTALQDPQRATRDSTLASILLLSLVEALTFRGRMDPDGWDAHTLGTATILEMRGERQLQTEVGRQLFVHAARSIRHRCTVRSIRTPVALQYLTTKLQERSDFNSDVAMCDLHTSFVMQRYADLRADMEHNTGRSSDWLRQAVAIEHHLNAIVAFIRKDVPYQTASRSSHLGAFAAAIDGFSTYGDEFHIHQSARAAKRWNNLRLLQLIIGGTARHCIVESQKASHSCNGDKLPSATSEEELAVAARLMQMGNDAAIDILHSVPYVLHLSNAPRLFVNNIILPLSGVVVMDMVPFLAKSFAQDRLLYIGEKLGIPQAMESLNMIREFDNLERWTVVTHVL